MDLVVQLQISYYGFHIFPQTDYMICEGIDSPKVLQLIWLRGGPFEKVTRRGWGWSRGWATLVPTGLKISFTGPSDKMSDAVEFGSDICPMTFSSVLTWK